MNDTLPPRTDQIVARRGPGQPLLYGEPTVKRSVDIPESLHTMLERLVAERNFKAGRRVTTVGRVIIDQLYEFFGVDNPSNGYPDIRS